MIRSCFGVMMILGAAAASAQTTPPPPPPPAPPPTAPSPAPFNPGYTDIGPTVGVGGIGSASLTIGGRFEHGIQTLPSLDNGILGIEVSADFYNYSTPGYSFHYTPLGVTANYHFRLDYAQLDPFFGIGLGYNIITCSYSGSGANGCYNSGLYFIGRAGFRYFFQPSMALYADVGAGAATFNVGVMFKLQ